MHLSCIYIMMKFTFSNQSKSRDQKKIKITYRWYAPLAERTRTQESKAMEKAQRYQIQNRVEFSAKRHARKVCSVTPPLMPACLFPTVCHSAYFCNSCTPSALFSSCNALRKGKMQNLLEIMLFRSKVALSTQFLDVCAKFGQFFI
jgi:hypothetical protein